MDLLTLHKPLVETAHLVVPDVFERVGDDGDAHVDQVRRGHLEHLLRKLLPVLVDFLKGEENSLVISVTDGHNVCCGFGLS